MLINCGHVHTEPPKGVRDCTVHNRTSNSVVVNCAPEFDAGGFATTFVLETYEHHKLLTNVTRADRPTFAVTGLLPDTHYEFAVYSINARGKSERTSVAATTATLSVSSAGECMSIAIDRQSITRI